MRGYRIKLKNRRISSAYGKDKHVHIEWKMLVECRVQRIAIKLTPQGATATLALLMRVCQEAMDSEKNEVAK